MAARSDWHRCKDWTLAERERFDAKIARSRQPWSKLYAAFASEQAIEADLDALDVGEHAA